MKKSTIAVATESQVVLEQVESIREAVNRRAYELFEGGGCCQGRDLEDWLQAEREIVSTPPIELTEKNGEVTLKVALAGFGSADLDVQVTPEDILIRSERVHERRGSNEKVYQTEFRRGKLFRAVKLPYEIDPKKTTTRLRNGLLQVTAPIAEPERPV